MEEKKLDINSIIGFVLIFAVLIFWFYTNQPTPEELKAQQQATEQVQDSLEQTSEGTAPAPIQPAVTVTDSAARSAYAQQVGAFAFTTAQDGTTTLENEVLSLEVSNRGGQIAEAVMKEFVNHDSMPVYLVREGNADFNLELRTVGCSIPGTSTLNRRSAGMATRRCCP